MHKLPNEQMEIYLIRHTSPAIEKGVCYGQTDLPLSPAFEQEKELLFRRLPASFDVVYTSPLSRCKELSRHLPAKRHVIDERLMEMNFGDWEMKCWSEVPRTQLDDWMASFVTYKVPHGESFDDVCKRAKGFWKEMTKEFVSSVAVVTHGGVIRALLTEALSMPKEKSFVFEIDYGKCCLIKANGDIFTIGYVNA